jgi:hypothetical protein
MMTVNLVTLNYQTGDYGDVLEKQVDFMLRQSAEVPGAHALFLYAVLKLDYSVKSPNNFICDENGCR